MINFKSIDFQILTKSNDWNQDQTKRLNEYQEVVNKYANMAALAVPYENTAKYINYVTDARTKGLRVWHRSHWDAWQGDNGVGDIATPTSLTRSGTTATCVCSSAHGMQTGDTVSMNGMNQTDYRGEFVITVINSTTFTYQVANSPTTPATGNIGWRYGRATYIRKTKAFIIANPTLFQPGDLFGMCVEADQADSSNMTFKTPGTTTFNTAIYNQFQKDQVSEADDAFATAGVTGVHTWAMSHQLSNVNLNGQVLDSGSTGNPDGLGNSDMVTYFKGFFCFDHYCSDAYTDPAVYAAAYSADLDAVHAAMPSCLLMIGEFGWRTIMPASEAEQDAIYAAVVAVIKSKPYVIGVNFWNHLGQTQSSLWNDTSGTIVAGGRLATRQVITMFTTPKAIKSVDIANIKSINGLALSSIKNINNL